MHRWAQDLLIAFAADAEKTTERFLNEACFMKNEMIIRISKGQQITIPSEYRIEFGWQVGSKVELTKEGNKIVIKPIGEDLQKLFEEAHNLKPKFRFTAKQMDEVVEREILGR